MQSNHSIEKFSEFMDMLGKKGLLNAKTAATRKQAALQVLSILTLQEKEELYRIDRDAVFKRFMTLNQSRFTPESLKTYRTRFYKALDDFLEWADDPIGFKPDVMSRRKPTASDVADTPGAAARLNEALPAPPARPIAAASAPLPIYLREELVVYIHHLPHDLTAAEAQKISRIVQAFAAEE